MKIHNLFICSSVCSYTVGAFCFLFTAFHQKVFLSHLPLFEFKYKIFTRLFIRYTSSTLLENRFLGLRKFLVCIRFCSCTQVYASYASVRIKYHFQLAENDVIEPLHFVPQNSGPGCYNLYFRWMKKKLQSYEEQWRVCIIRNQENETLTGSPRFTAGVLFLAVCLKLKITINWNIIIIWE